MTINHGSTYLVAGPTFLEGTPQSLPTAPPEEINDFEQVSSVCLLVELFTYINMSEFLLPSTFALK